MRVHLRYEKTTKLLVSKRERKRGLKKTNASYLDHLHKGVEGEQGVRAGLVHGPDPVHGHHLGNLVEAAMKAIAELGHVLHVENPREEDVEDLEEVLLVLRQRLAGQDLSKRE